MVFKLTDLYNIVSTNRNAARDGYTRPSIGQHFSSRGVFKAVIKDLLRASDLVSPQGLLNNDDWVYLDSGEDPGNNWQTQGFDDSGWVSGKHPFGFGYGYSIGTTLSGNRAAYYFRTKTFLYDDTPEIEFDLHYDDGIAVYVNGVEVFRHNLPEAGECDYTSLADVSHTGVLTTFVDSDNFVKGENTIAVELHNVSIVNADAFFQLITKGLGSTLLKGPYLMLQNGEGTTVLWQLSETSTCTLSWGTDVDNLDNHAIVNENASGEYDHVYSYTITGLDSKTRYYYSVVENGVCHVGDFVSPVASNSTTANFFTLGDTAAYPEKHNSLYNLMLSDMEQDTSKQSFLLHLGDVVGDASDSDLDEEAAWTDDIFSLDYRGTFNFMSRVPWVLTRGNHDVRDVIGTSDALRKYWPQSYVNATGFYHSFDCGPIHFIVVDQYTDYDVGSTQYNWIDADLRATLKPWKIMTFHEPAYTNHSERHGDDAYAQGILQPLCETYGIQLVLTGHNHSYSRVSVNGVQHVTAAGGGGLLYTGTGVVDEDATLECYSRNYHYCWVSVDGDTLTLKATSIDGELIESFDIIEDLTNSAPSVVTASVFTCYETAISISVLDNASDVDNDALFLHSIGQPTNGTASGVDNTVLYTPNSNYYGQDSFEYTISDGTVLVNGTMNITVNEHETFVEPVGNINRIAICTDEHWEYPTYAGKGTEFERDSYYDAQYESIFEWSYNGARDLTISGTNDNEVVEIIDKDCLTAAPATIENWTTDASHIILIRAVGTARNKNLDGSFSDAAYSLQLDNGATPIVVSNASPIHIHIDGIQAKTNSSGGIGACLAIEGSVGVVEVTNSYLYSTSTAYYAGGVDITSDSGAVYIWNCVCAGGNQGITQRAAGTTTKVYNSVITGFMDDAIESDYHDLSCYNCVVFNNDDDFKETFTELSHCASDDADGIDAVSLNENVNGEWTNAFVDYTVQDFRIKDVNSLLYNTGKDVGGEWTDLLGQTQVGTDIAGNDFVTNDIGPFAYQN